MMREGRTISHARGKPYMSFLNQGHDQGRRHCSPPFMFSLGTFCAMHSFGRLHPSPLSKPLYSIEGGGYTSCQFQLFDYAKKFHPALLSVVYWQLHIVGAGRPGSRRSRHSCPTQWQCRCLRLTPGQQCFVHFWLTSRSKQPGHTPVRVDCSLSYISSYCQWTQVYFIRTLVRFSQDTHIRQ